MTREEKLASLLKEFRYDELMALGQHISESASGWAEDQGAAAIDAKYFASLLSEWADDTLSED